MSKFNSYAVRLDTAFKTSREAFEKALTEFNASEKRLADAKAWHPEAFHGQNAARKAAAEAAFYSAKAEFEAAKRTIWPAFEQEVSKITRELEAAIRESNIATPDQVDPNGLELLKSGVMTADDFESLASRYDSNPTMLRLVGKYASESADALSTDASRYNERARLSHIAYTARNGRSARLQDFDNLVKIAKTCAGITHDGKHSYLPQMGAHWDSADTQGIIENF